MITYNKVTIEDLDVAGKRVLVRCDFNVPMKEGKITNDNRIVAALPTIKYLMDKGGRLILCSHLGKPKNGPEEKFSLAPVAVRLSELLGKTGVKGCVAVGADADLLVLDDELNIDALFARGRTAVQDGKVILKGRFEV